MSPRSKPAPGSTPPRSCTRPRPSRSRPGSAAAPARPPRSPPSPRSRPAAPSTPTPPPTRPFYLHLTRGDGEQEITSYSATLPPGLLGKIGGIPFCPEADDRRGKAPNGRRIRRRTGLPRGLADRPHRHRLRRRLVALLRAGHPLPRRPLPRLAAVGGRDRLGQGRALRPRHGGDPLGDPDQLRRPPRSRSTPPARIRSPTSSTASRCACATSASTSTAPTSWSTRPPATRSRSPRP